MKNIFTKFCLMFVLVSLMLVSNIVVLAEETENVNVNKPNSSTVMQEKTKSEKSSHSKAHTKSFTLKSSNEIDSTQKESLTKVKPHVDNSNANASSQSKVNSKQESATTQKSAVSSTSRPMTKSQTEKTPIPEQNSSVAPQQSVPQPQNTKKTMSTSHSEAVVEEQSPSRAPAVSESANNSEQIKSKSTEPEKKENEPSVDVVPSKATMESQEEKPQTPEDLPQVDSSELDFPEVTAPNASEPTNSLNYWAGLIGWGCLLIGVVIIIFVMLKGRYNSEMPVQIVSRTKKRKRKNEPLLSKEYYKERF